MIDLSTDAGLRRAFDDISTWGEPAVVPDLEQLGAVRLATSSSPSGRARMLVAVGVVLLLVVAGAVLVTRDDPPPAVAAAGGEWSAMAESPLAPRRYPTSLWTGDEALIWGGIGGTAFADGARYRPRTDSWEPMAPAPSGVTGGRVLAAWTGEEAVYVTSVVDPATGGSGWDYDIIAYDPAADVWRTLVQARFEQDPATNVLFPLGSVPLDGPEALVVVDGRLLLFGWVSTQSTYTWVELEPGSGPSRPLLGTADWYGRSKVVQVAGDQVYVGLTGLVGETTGVGATCWTRAQAPRGPSLRRLSATRQASRCTRRRWRRCRPRRSRHRRLGSIAAGGVATRSRHSPLDARGAAA